MQSVPTSGLGGLEPVAEMLPIVPQALVRRLDRLRKSFVDGISEAAGKEFLNGGVARLSFGSG